MTFGDYLRVVRDYWRSILAIILVTVVVGIIASSRVTPTYTADAKVLFTGSAGSKGQDIASVASYTATRMSAYRALVSTPQVLEGSGVTPGADGEVADDIAATYTLGSTILTVTVVDGSAKRAAQVADGVAGSLVASVERIETPNDDDTSVVKGEVISPATEPADPTSPNLLINIVGAALVGIVLALGASVLRHLWATGRIGRRPTKPGRGA